MKEETFAIKVPWGVWDASTKAWYPNPYIPVTEEQQRSLNLAQGYQCGMPIQPITGESTK